MAVARRRDDVELVSVDSMQVYRGMDIGTAKPTLAEQAEVPCHLIDLADPGEDFSLARFQAAAAEVIAGIEARRHRALLVGGTGLYLQAVVDSLTLPGQWPEVRVGLEAEARTPAGVGALHRRLSDTDPAAAARIGPANSRRIVRALEVTIGSGRPFSSFGPGLGVYPPSRFLLAGVWLPRQVVADRIAHRYVDQLASGFVAEVAALAARAGGLSRTARQALGYRELLDHLAGHSSLDDAVNLAVRRTARFARRQRAWFRRDPRITWFGSARNPVAALPALLGHWAP